MASLGFATFVVRGNSMAMINYYEKQAGRVWCPGVLNTLCALFPAVGIFLFFTVSSSLYRTPFHSRWGDVVALTFIATVIGMPVAGCIYLWSQSRKAQEAAWSFACGFFLGIIALGVFSGLLP